MPGFQAWSVKAGVPHVHPPACVLETMLAVRLHLDDSDEASGPLRVLLPVEEIGRTVESGTPVPCTVGRGGALLMRPLLLHASSPASRPARRRVLHLEFGRPGLPGGLDWFESPEPDPRRRRVSNPGACEENRRYWPFDVSPTTPTHHAQVDFLKAAFEEGFTPYLSWSENLFDASNDRLSRCVWLTCRGRQRWEVGLVERGERRRGFILEGFERCARAALRWLRGEDADVLLETCGPIWRKTWPVA